METLVWLRVPGDVVFAAGCVFLAQFAIKLVTGARGSNVVVGSVAPGKR
jgi:nitric oxide reductase subunit B